MDLVIFVNKKFMRGTNIYKCIFNKIEQENVSIFQIHQYRKIKSSSTIYDIPFAPSRFDSRIIHFYIFFILLFQHAKWYTV